MFFLKGFELLNCYYVGCMLVDKYGRLSIWFSWNVWKGVDSGMVGFILDYELSGY